MKANFKKCYLSVYLFSKVPLERGVYFEKY